MQMLKNDVQTKAYLNINKISENDWRLEGAITIDTVALLPKLDAWPKALPLTIDFEKVIQIDSAAIAWLLQQYQFSRKRQFQLTYCNMLHVSFQTLFEIYNIGNLFF